MGKSDGPLAGRAAHSEGLDAALFCVFFRRFFLRLFNFILVVLKEAVDLRTYFDEAVYVERVRVVDADGGAPEGPDLVYRDVAFGDEVCDEGHA